MRKKRNIFKRNSGFIIGCVLAAGASGVTANTVMTQDLALMISPETEMTEAQSAKTVETEKAENRTYETDPFTVTASGNIIKGVETEPQTEKKTDENGNAADGSGETAEDDGSVTEGETDEDGNAITSGSSQGEGTSASEGSDGSYSGDSGYSGDGSYSGDSGYSGDGSYSGDSGYSGDTSYSGDGGSGGGQPIEIYDPGNGSYSYTDDGGSGGSGSTGNTGTSASTPSDVIIQGICSRYIDVSELYNYSAGQLRLIRNEIFALHGRIFNSQDLMDYFSRKSWYVPTYSPEEFDARMFEFLNDYEEANLQVILDYEAALAGN